MELLPVELRKKLPPAWCGYHKSFVPGPELHNFVSCSQPTLILWYSEGEKNRDGRWLFHDSEPYISGRVKWIFSAEEIAERARTAGPCP